MAELTKIEYPPRRVAHFTTTQQWMAATIAESINYELHQGHMTPQEAREALRFLLAQLEEK